MLRSYSQAGQDIFVYNILYKGMNIKNGYFLDIGCSQPFIDNNTFVLENLGWRGILLDVYDVANDPNHVAIRDRKSPFICADATTINWDTLNIPYSIDYISFDIDSATIKGIDNFPWKNCRTKIITIEHDIYHAGSEAKIKIYNTLTEYGYTLVCDNVKNHGDMFEDWFVDTNVVPEYLWEKYKCHNKEYQDIVDVVREPQPVGFYPPYINSFIP